MSRIRQEQIRSETAPSGYVLVSDGDGNVNWGDILNITTLDEISDVSLVTVVSGEVLTYNGAEWINNNISITSSGVTTLDELSDVEIISPASGESLVYNGVVWINSEITASGSSSANVNITFAETTTTVGSTDTTNTTQLFNYLEGYVMVLTPIKILSVLWYTRNAGDYTFEIRSGIGGTVLAEAPIQACSAATLETFTITGGPYLIYPGYYGFRLTKSGAAVQWRDGRTGQPFYYNRFSILGGIYDGSTASYAPPLKLVYYDGAWTIT